MAESADDRLRLLIERIERLEEEKKGISDDIKDVYSEAKAICPALRCWRTQSEFMDLLSCATL